MKTQKQSHKCISSKMLAIVEVYSCKHYLTQQSVYSQFGITMCRTNAEQIEDGFLLFSQGLLFPSFKEFQAKPERETQPQLLKLTY